MTSESVVDTRLTADQLASSRLPAARQMGQTAHGGTIVTGFPTVLIGG